VTTFSEVLLAGSLLLAQRESPTVGWEGTRYCNEHMSAVYSGSRDGTGAVLLTHISGREEAYTGLTSYSYGGKYQEVGFLVAVAKSEKDLILFYKNRAVISKDGQVTALPLCSKQ